MNILDRLSIESDGTVQSRTGNVTIGFLTKTIGEKFKFEMDIESFDQESSEVIFPIMFCIQMNPDDYEARTPFFERWGPIILARIYSIIKKKKHRMEIKHKVLGWFGIKCPKVNYIPTDARWCIQFTVDDQLKKGVINPILSYKIPFKVEFADNAPRIVQDPNATMMTRNPKTKEVIPQSMDGIQILGEGIRLYRFDKSLQDDSDNIKGMFSNTNKELATLRWDNLEWSMRDTYIEISGAEETRNEMHILKINSDKIKRTHAAIRYKDNMFQLAAWGATMLNQRFVELSTDTSNVKWVKLPNNSSIVLNNTKVIKFKVNSDL